MNALRAPLTALYVSNGKEIVFSVDSADAFIDSPQPKGNLEKKWTHRSPLLGRSPRLQPHACGVAHNISQPDTTCPLRCLKHSPCSERLNNGAVISYLLCFA